MLSESFGYASVLLYTCEYYGFYTLSIQNNEFD